MEATQSAPCQRDYRDVQPLFITGKVPENCRQKLTQLSTYSEKAAYRQFLLLMALKSAKSKSVRSERSLVGLARPIPTRLASEKCYVTWRGEEDFTTFRMVFYIYTIQQPKIPTSGQIIVMKQRRFMAKSVSREKLLEESAEIDYIKSVATRGKLRSRVQEVNRPKGQKSTFNPSTGHRSRRKFNRTRTCHLHLNV